MQLYVALPQPNSKGSNNIEFPHPILQLRAFSKVKDLAPGESKTVELTLDKGAVSYWSDNMPLHRYASDGEGEYGGRWVISEGEYDVKVGTSSRLEDLVLDAKFTIEKKGGFEWRGL